jgi:hypothetical protein
MAWTASGTKGDSFMNRKWLLFAAVLLVVFCGYLLLNTKQRIQLRGPSNGELKRRRVEIKATPAQRPSDAEVEARRPEVKAILEADKQRASALQSEVTRKDWFPYGGAHYPDLPTELLFSQSGRGLTLLKEAASKHDIEVWADENEMYRVLDLRSSKVKTCVLVIGDGGLCGACSWVVYAYGYYAPKDGDPKPWKLLYVGSGGPSTSNQYAIDRVYIDDKLGCLVFADGRTGKVTHTTRIAREIELMQER